MNQANFEETYRRISYKERYETKVQDFKSSLQCSNRLFLSILTHFLSFLPILTWLPKYQIFKFLPKDLITGLIVGIMNVPQGMAYASLAQVPPVYGLYTAFFSGFFYVFFGTSSHISVGVFAVGSLMVGSVRLRIAPDTVKNLTGLSANETFGEEITPVMVISALSFGVGAVQVILGLLHLSFVTTYMSDQLISGYTTGSAFHVLASQLDKLFGVKIGHYEGAFVLYYTVRDIIKLVPTMPIAVIIMSAIGIIYLYIAKEYLNPVVKKCCPIPIPHELFLVIATTLFSHFTNAKKEFHVNVVDNIPKGFPPLQIPRFDLLSQMIADCIIIAIICYMFVISMAKLFAKKHKYPVDDNQELYAIGFTSILSSFFPTYPAGASLSRSSVCEMSGVKTQLYGLFSSGLLLVVILWLGPLLEPLPMCVLACIIAVSLKGLFLQFGELPKLWRTSKYDFAIWIVACFSTIITDPTYGLGIALGFILLTILFREQWPSVYHLSTNTSFEYFKPSKIYKSLHPIGKHIQIYKFNSPLHFANVTKFNREISDLMTPKSSQAIHINDQPQILTAKKSELVEKLKRLCKSIFRANFCVKAAEKIDVNNHFPTTNDIENFYYMSQPKNIKKISQNSSNEPKENIEGQWSKEVHQIKSLSDKTLHSIIIDCSSISYIDTMGIEALKEAYKDAETKCICIFFAEITDQVLDAIECGNLYEIVPREKIFPTVRQAVFSLIPPTINGANRDRKIETLARNRTKSF